MNNTRNDFEKMLMHKANIEEIKRLDEIKIDKTEVMNLQWLKDQDKDMTIVPNNLKKQKSSEIIEDNTNDNEEVKDFNENNDNISSSSDDDNRKEICEKDDKIELDKEKSDTVGRRIKRESSAESIRSNQSRMSKGGKSFSTSTKINKLEEKLNENLSFINNIQNDQSISNEKISLIDSTLNTYIKDNNDNNELINNNIKDIEKKLD